jgi:ankyrin repeat protein
MKTRQTFFAIIAGTLLLGTPAAQAGGLLCLVRDIKQQGQQELSQAGVTDLMRAAAAGDIEAAKRAVDKGDNVNAHTATIKLDRTGGVTALMVAAGRSKREMVQWLIEHGADVNARSANGQTALSRAVIADENQHSIATVKTLLRAGADPTASEPKDISLAEIAAVAGSKTAAGLLQDRSAARVTAKK